MSEFTICVNAPNVTKEKKRKVVEPELKAFEDIEESVLINAKRCKANDRYFLNDVDRVLKRKDKKSIIKFSYPVPSRLKEEVWYAFSSILFVPWRKIKATLRSKTETWK